MILRSVLLAVCFAASAGAGETHVALDFSKRAQVIENIGSSTGMHGDYIARHWRPETVDAIADLLFSRRFDADGAAEGIGLSSFRIQIGGGGAGEAGGIKEPWRRTDCFLRPDGTYDWSGQGQGTLYWRRKALEYDVPTVIGYLNSPPVYFTHSGYTFKTNETFTTNLRDECFDGYAQFLARVAAHGQALGMPFTHLSPVNEPQWFWKGTPGRAKQEGSPWTNGQIARLVRLADAAFRDHGVSTKLLIPEAADYDALATPMPERPFAAATDQVRAFWGRDGGHYVGDLPSLETVAAGHAYFSDGSVDELIHTRTAVKKAVEDVGSGLRFWQTEYSLLGQGWTGGLPAWSVDEMDAALLLARNIHVDFTLADAAAWQWWSSTEPKLGRVPRYCLIECDPHGDQTYRATKLLWALGHYSRFVRPGMVRVPVEAEGAVAERLARVMASAYYDADRHRWAMVVINFTNRKQEIRFSTKRLPRSEERWTTAGFLTDRKHDLQRFDLSGDAFSMPPKSIVTLLGEPAPR
ncbi:glycoside hydrolase [Pontiella sp.]|uniref:glycoside hydrolase n=1 Tax=Pontiella sp. TaxID=2837462 RepID=UPI0035639289